MILEGRCWHCGINLEDFRRDALCSTCKKDTRSCKNCFFYDPTYHNQCRENQAEFISEKEQSNFCAYFRPHMDTQKNITPSKKDLLKQAEALFKKK